MDEGTNVQTEKLYIPILLYAGGRKIVLRHKTVVLQFTVIQMWMLANTSCTQNILQ
jgi:hypothetical protein